MDYYYPILAVALRRGNISLRRVARAAGLNVGAVRRKMRSGVFDINQAMAIHRRLFPQIPFDVLFFPQQGCEKSQSEKGFGK